MSGHGGHRPGSGRKRIYASKKVCSNVWQRGHRRISLDGIIYSSWITAKIMCGYKSDNDFASHLLSLERRRRSNDPVVSCGKRKDMERDAAPSAKRRRHIEGHPLSTSTPIKPGPISVQSPNLSVEAVDATSDIVDVTGISEFSVNNSTYQVADDSVILQNDAEKYEDSDESISDSDSSDEIERTDRTLRDALADALHELDEDDAGSLSDTLSSDADELEYSMHVEENDYGNELCAGDSDDESEEGCEIHVDSSSPTSAIPPLSWPLSTVPPSSSSTSTIAIPPSSPTLTIALSSSAASSVPPPSTSASTTPLPCSVASSFQPNSTATPILLPISAVSAVPLPTPTTSSPAQTYPKLSRLEEQNSLQEELALVRQTKVICSLDLLLDVFKRCQHPGCNKATALKHHLNGPTAVIKWTCSSGHRGTFSTSRDQNEIYANNLQVAASIMLSGTILQKLKKWQISLACHLSQNPPSTECRGCILFPLLTSGGAGKGSN